MKRRLTMKYTKEERLDIGRRIYDGEISRYQAAEIYDISEQTARDYMRLYRDANQPPAKRGTKASVKAPSLQTAPANMEELESMTKEQLIQELVKARITETRLKKGYEVKGDGTVILYGNRNTK
jgi:transposase